MQRTYFHPIRLMSFLLFSILILLSASSLSATHEKPAHDDADRTLSPYFFVPGDDPSVDQLPLKSTAVQLKISGVIADVTVRQTYQNQGKKALEAIYTFPASTRAAVYGMRMTIGERTIVAQIDRREQARLNYEQARLRGQSASLLEQQRPNMFQMNVANILPGDSVEVELKYTELLVPEKGQYEFVYPTVVGPRYSNLTEDGAPVSENWVANPYLHAGTQPSSSLTIDAQINAGMPIQSVACTSHKTDISYLGKNAARIILSPDEAYGGNRDYILRYQLAGSAIESGLLLHKGQDENYFLMMLEPPARVKLTDIPPREYIFIVDVSGSMNGFPLDVSKSLLRELIGKLRPHDHFNVLLFANSSEMLASTSLPANQANVDKALHFINHQRGGGGTEILPALQRALALPQTDEAAARTIVIATDGYVRVEPQVFDLIRSNLGAANLFAFGIGKSVNRHLIEGMAHAGMGEPFVMTTENEARRQAKRFAEMVQSPVLTHIKIDFGQFAAYDIEPLSAPDVLAQRPVIVFGKWRGPARGQIKLDGQTAEGRYQKTISVSDFTGAQDNPALRYLWARHRLQSLSDYSLLQHGRDNELIEQITELGLRHNLLTAYTSFVAIDSEVRNSDGQTTQVKQPLPMPQGVSDLAIGGGVAVSGIQMLQKGRAAHSAPAVNGGIALALEEAVPEMVVRTSDLSEARVQIFKLAVTGALSEAEFRAVLEQHHANLEAILRQMTNTLPGTGGEITFELRIAANGKTEDVRLVQYSLTRKANAAQLLHFMQKMRFPSKGVASEVRVTLKY